MKKQRKAIKDRIHEYVEGNLSPEEVDQLWSELIARPNDLDYMQTLSTLKEMGASGKMDQLLETESDERKPTVYEMFKPYLVAASIIIISFSVLFNVMTDVDQSQNTEPISAIEFDIERSADNQTMLDIYLQEAVSLATNGNLEAAYAQLDEASSLDLTLEQSIDIRMVKGAIEYNSQNYTSALETFESINKLEAIGLMDLEKGTWYLANSQLQLGMTDSAIESLEKVIELDGAFSRVAKSKLESLQQPAI